MPLMNFVAVIQLTGMSSKPHRYRPRARYTGTPTAALRLLPSRFHRPGCRTPRSTGIQVLDLGPGPPPGYFLACVASHDHCRHLAATARA